MNWCMLHISTYIHTYIFSHVPLKPLQSVRGQQTNQLTDLPMNMCMLHISYVPLRTQTFIYLTNNVYNYIQIVNFYFFNKPGQETTTKTKGTPSECQGTTDQLTDWPTNKWVLCISYIPIEPLQSVRGQQTNQLTGLPINGCCASPISPLNPFRVSGDNSFTRIQY